MPLIRSLQFIIVQKDEKAITRTYFYVMIIAFNRACARRPVGASLQSISEPFSTSMMLTARQTRRRNPPLSAGFSVYGLKQPEGAYATARA